MINFLLGTVMGGVIAFFAFCLCAVSDDDWRNHE